MVQRRRRVIKDSELARLTEIIGRVQDFPDRTSTGALVRCVTDANVVGLLDDLTNDALNLLLAAHTVRVRVESSLDRRKAKKHRRR